MRRALTLLFFGLVAVLLVRQARGIAWGEVLTSMRNASPAMLAAAAGLAACSHLLYSSFDLFGRYITGHGLPVPRVMATTFVSYVFNLNLGSLIGGIAFRYRLYARQGLATELVTTIVATSMLTNWLGFVALGGLVLMLQPPTLPPDWSLANGPLRLIGAAMAALALAWVLACGFARRREWRVRGHTITLPSGRLALLQLAASSSNWLLMASVVYLLLGRRIEFPLVLGTLLVAAVAGVLTHVPAGLGVLEAVFVALLSSQLPKGELLGALLLYRAIYYLAPLLPAVGLHAWLEARSKPVATGQA